MFDGQPKVTTSVQLRISWIVLAGLGLRRSWLLELLPYMHEALASVRPTEQKVTLRTVPASPNPKTRCESQCTLGLVPLFLVLSVLLRRHFCAFTVLELLECLDCCLLVFFPALLEIRVDHKNTCHFFFQFSMF